MSHKDGHDDNEMSAEEFDYLMGEETSVEEPPIVVNENEIIQPQPSAKYQSIFDLIQTNVALPMFYFDSFLEDEVETYAGKKELNLLANGSQFFSIKEIMTKPEFAPFITQELKNTYNTILNNPTIKVQDDFVNFITELGQTLDSGQKTQRVPNTYQSVDATDFQPTVILQYNKKETENGNMQLGADKGLVSYVNIADNIANQNFNKIVKEEEVTVEQDAQERRVAAAQETIVSEGIIRTSSPAWGYSTDNEGYQKVIAADGSESFESAPFFKGEEYSRFNTLDQSEILLLQQSLVRAGMVAPRIDEYGVWTDREANFMSVIFMRATDTGQARKDIANGLEGWETTLKEVSENFAANEGFIELLKAGNYGSQAPNVAPSTVHAMLKKAAAANGVELSSKDLVNYASVVTNALTQEADLQKQFDNAAVTDRDIILNAQFKDPRAIKDGEMPRFFTGNNMPLVLPSYDYLTQGKGGLASGLAGDGYNKTTAPTLRSAQEIVNEQIDLMTQNQQAGNTTLADMKYSANLFEQSMGMIGYGDTP